MSKVFSGAHYGWKILEPRLVRLPNVESHIEAPVNPGQLLALKPDIVPTMDPTMAGQIQKLGVPTVVITAFDYRQGHPVLVDPGRAGPCRSRSGSHPASESGARSPAAARAPMLSRPPR